jgi:hypothetical protein
MDRAKEFEFQLLKLKEEDFPTFGKFFLNFLAPALAITHPQDEQTVPFDIEADLSILLTHSKEAYQYDRRIKAILDIVETHDYGYHFRMDKPWLKFDEEEKSQLNNLRESNRLTREQKEWYYGE